MISDEANITDTRFTLTGSGPETRNSAAKGKFHGLAPDSGGICGPC